MVRTCTPVPSDAFSDHLAQCPDCDVKLDGTGPVCPSGEAALASVDWPAVSAARDQAVFTANGTMAALLHLVLLKEAKPCTGS